MTDDTKIVHILFWCVFFILAVVIINNLIRYTDFYTHIQIDERVYRDTVDAWNKNGVSGLNGRYETVVENKPVSFLLIQRILNADILYTRLLNLIIIIVISLLLYKQSKNPLSFIFILIPLFLSSMWLTVEIFEILFLLLSIHLPRHSGLFTSLAVIFRPYALIYAIFLKGTQRVYFSVILSAFVIIMYAYGILFQYAETLIKYGSSSVGISETLGLYLLFPLMIIAVNGDKILLKYAIISCIPLLFRTWAHYLLPTYTFLFLSYLKQNK